MCIVLTERQTETAIAADGSETRTEQSSRFPTLVDTFLFSSSRAREKDLSVDCLALSREGVHG
jgi:hypothetical protein